jgi:hypothetical protein
MGFFDDQMYFSQEQRVCDGGATEASEDVYDFGVASPNVAKGEPITLLFTVDEVFAGTATTLTITLQSSSDNAVADPYADIAGITTGAIAKATLVAGYNFTLTLPAFAVYERYLRVMYTGDNTFETTGKISCRQALNYQTNKAPGA